MVKSLLHKLREVRGAPLAGALSLLTLCGWGLQCVGRSPASAGATRPLCLTAPAGAVRIEHGADLQRVVDGHPSGTAFLVAAGVHRLQTIRPRSGDSFYGERGPNCERWTRLSGAIELTDFSPADGLFAAVAQIQAGQLHGFCEPGFERCVHPEELFVDDVPLRHVAMRDQVGPGRWFFDYETGRVYLANAPVGRVELATTRVAFAPTAPDVSIVGLVIEKYASPAQSGAIGDMTPAAGWQIEDCELRLNHGVGASVSGQSVVRGCHIHHNGQLGIGGSDTAGGAGIRIEANEIDHNGFAGFVGSWEAGGVKFTSTQGLQVRGNCVHRNQGTGLWLDIGTTDSLVEGNVVFRNRDQGIFHEVSGPAVIRGNRSGLNGRRSAWLYGTNILVASSAGADVQGNLVEVHASHGNGITVLRQEREDALAGALTRVRGNEIRFLGPGGLAGAGTDFPGGAPIWAETLFEGNTYRMQDPDEPHFVWSGGTTSLAGFQATGQDTTGTLQPLGSPLAWECELDGVRRPAPADRSVPIPLFPTMQPAGS